MHISNFLTKEQEDALFLLARRKNSKCLKWFRMALLTTLPPYPSDIKDRPSYECCICNYQLFYSRLPEHGIQHLKESNLLVFI